MKKPKISIIVAVYNTEKYIRTCLDSLLLQTYSNLEIIVIDDASTDQSKQVLKEYENEKKIRIVYNETNKGLAYNRNLGMDIATGDYLGFIDSDDSIPTDYYEKLMLGIEKEKADISICDIKLVYEETKTEKVNLCYDGNSFHLLSVLQCGLVASCCNKLFKRDLINQYKFEVGKVNEDIAVVVPALVHAKKLAYVKNCYYNYVQRESSIQNSRFSEKRFDIFDGVETTLKRVSDSKYYNDIKDILVFNQLILLLFYVIPKERSFFYRQKILKKYFLLAKKYDCKNNNMVKAFIKRAGKKHQLYYNMLLSFQAAGFCMLSNLLISVFQFLVKRKKSVIPKKISIDNLIKLAKRQQALAEPQYKISVVVPNYNYAIYLYQRMYSILNQNYKLYEIILLDDCSTDLSKDTIKQLVDALSPYIRIISFINEKNTGSAFKQWQKGFSMAKGDYVWIAEADDFCKKNLISSLVDLILKDNQIVISYAATAFINANGAIRMKTILPQIDLLQTNHWNTSYIIDGIEELKNYTYLNCTIANVSSCIIKNRNYDSYFEEALQYKQAGDWVFYANVMRTGKVAYINKTLNYYRVHTNNISTTMNKEKHLEEIKKIHAKFRTELALGKEHEKQMLKRIAFLEKEWGLEGEKNNEKK